MRGETRYLTLPETVYIDWYSRRFFTRSRLTLFSECCSNASRYRFVVGIPSFRASAQLTLALGVVRVNPSAGTWQSFLTGLRFLIMVLMVGSVLSSLWTGGEPFGEGVRDKGGEN